MHPASMPSRDVSIESEIPGWASSCTDPPSSGASLVGFLTGEATQKVSRSKV